MSIVADIFHAFGLEIGDPGNAKVPPQRLYLWLNRVLKDAVLKTNCLWDTIALSGEYDIEILDYASLNGEKVTLQTSKYAVSTDYTEGALADWEATVSNSKTATNLAAALNAYFGVIAYAIGAHVYVIATSGETITVCTSDADTDYLTVTAGAETFDFDSILTSYRRVNDIYSLAENLIYLPAGRQEYIRGTIDSTYEGYMYSVMQDGGRNTLYLKHAGGNILPSVVFYVDYLQWATAISALSTSLPGTLDNFDDMIVKGMLYHYYNSQANYELAVNLKSIFNEEARRVRKELRSHGAPQQMRHFLKVAND